jgi:transcriptional regulator with XRE-family HTH domain
VHYRLRWAMESANVEPEELAEILGVHPNTVLNYVAGRTRVKDGVIRLWAIRTGYPFEWLKTGVRSEGPGDGGPVTNPATGREPCHASVHPLNVRARRHHAVGYMPTAA